jgi:hypothetical protein
MIDLIRVKKPGTFSELRARPRDWDLIRASPSRPATSEKVATKGRTKDRTRSRVQKFRKSLQTERHPQKKVRRRSTAHRHLPKETGIETSLKATNSINMADLQGFQLIFGQFQWMTAHPDDHSKFREIDPLPKRIWRTEKRAIRTEWRKSAISEA